MRIVCGRQVDAIKQSGTVIGEEFLHKVIMQLARGLDYMHRHSYIHRDIKLENVYISVGKDIKVSNLVRGGSCDNKPPETRPSSRVVLFIRW